MGYGVPKWERKCAIKLTYTEQKPTVRAKEETPQCSRSAQAKWGGGGEGRGEVQLITAY